MNTNPIVSDPGKEGQLARALNVALQVLVVHHGMRARSNGGEITLNFYEEIQALKRALAILGVDASSETLPNNRPSDVR